MDEMLCESLRELENSRPLAAPRWHWQQVVFPQLDCGPLARSTPFPFLLSFVQSAPCEKCARVRPARSADSASGRRLQLANDAEQANTCYFPSSLGQLNTAGLESKQKVILVSA